jgi:hypothetical protein
MRTRKMDAGAKGYSVDDEMYFTADPKFWVTRCGKRPAVLPVADLF